jgi:hypothetical protein
MNTIFRSTYTYCTYYYNYPASLPFGIQPAQWHRDQHLISTTELRGHDRTMRRDKYDGELRYRSGFMQSSYYNAVYQSVSRAQP